MKARYGLGIGVIICVLVVVAVFPKNWALVPYDDPTEAFSIDFPKDWRTRTHPQSDMFDTAYAVSAHNPALAIEEGRLRQRRGGIIVRVEHLESGWSLDRYGEAALEFWQGEFPAFQLLEDGETMLDGHPSRWALYTYCYGSGAPTLGDLVYLTVVDGRAFVITCTAAADALERDRKQYERVASSLRIEG